MTTVGRRVLAAEGDIRYIHSKPGDFQYQDMGNMPIDDPMDSMRDLWELGYPPRAKFVYRCPTGERVNEVVIQRPDLPYSHPCWEWNGNTERPTLSPALICHGGGTPCWTGFVSQGQFKDLMK